MRFLKVIVPPVIAFWAFAVFIKFTHFFHHVDGWSEIGEDSVYGLISYYKGFAPFQIIIAILTQYLIILPLWDKILARHKVAITIVIGIILICIIAAGGLAYIIWDRATGVKHLINIALFMTGVQLFYWFINFLVLFLFDIKSFLKINAKPEEN